MVYMSVAGGPFGIEEILGIVPIREALAILLFAFVTHFLPTMYMTYEMVTTYSDITGGSIGWVEKATGKTFGLINAVYNIVDTAVDNAIYPVIINDNLGMDGPTLPIVFCVLSAFLNWNGSEVTGKATIIQTVVILLPFIYMMVVTPVNRNMYADTRSYEKPDFFRYQEVLMITIWNFSGFDMCASYVNTLRPQKNDIKFSFSVTAFITLFFYAAPMCIGTFYLHDAKGWYDGSWTSIGSQLLGEAGTTAIQIASIVSSLSTLCVELCATAYLWMGLVNLNAVPHIFKNYKFNLVVNTVITIILSSTQPFEVLVEVSALLNVSTIIFESIAWIKLFGVGKYYHRLAVASILVITNICVSLCFSRSCLFALITASCVGIFWIFAIKIYERQRNE